MRGAKVETQGMFSYVSPEQRVPQDHPLRAIRVIMDRSLAELKGHFSTIYSPWVARSIRPARTCLNKSKADFLLHRGRFHRRLATTASAFLSTGFTFGGTRRRAA
jgi:hypothetical protein